MHSTEMTAGFSPFYWEDKSYYWPFSAALRLSVCRNSHIWTECTALDLPQAIPAGPLEDGCGNLLNTFCFFLWSSTKFFPLLYLGFANCTFLHFQHTSNHVNVWFWGKQIPVKVVTLFCRDFSNQIQSCYTQFTWCLLAFMWESCPGQMFWKCALSTHCSFPHSVLLAPS